MGWMKRFLSIYLLMLAGAFAGMLAFSWLEHRTLVALGTKEIVTACLVMPWAVAVVGPLFFGGAVAMRFLPDGIGFGLWVHVALAVVFILSYAPLGYLVRKFLGDDTVFARVLSALLLLAYTSYCSYGILCVGAGV